MEQFDLQSVLAQIMGEEPVEITETVTTVVTKKVAMTALHETPVLVPAGTPMVSTVEEIEEVEEDGDALPGTAVALSFPQFTDETIAATMDIRNYATMCKLKVRKWQARIKDKGASRKSEKDSGAVEGTYSTYKNLFKGIEDKLKAVNSVLDAARTRHYQMTLPWSTSGLDDSARRDGPRMLANTLFMEYITEMGEAKQRVEQARVELRSAYPAMITAAKQNLKGAFNLADYPDESELDSYFSLDFDFAPIPDGGDFKGLPAQQVKALSDKLNKSRQLCMENAMRDVWQRSYNVVTKMHERLSDPKKTFHDTLVSNVRDLTELLGHMNATQDQKVEHVRLQMEQNLCKFDPEVLRKDLTKRALVAKLAGELLQDMANV